MSTGHTVLFFGCAIATIMGALLLIVFRRRPERLAQATEAGETPESIDRQLETLRRVRMYGWWVLIVGACGMVLALATR